MTDYAIGDVQGCNKELGALLEKIDFSPGRDRIYLLGDLVNRGPDSLGVLRRVRALGQAAECVLGNHDLHLLAHAAGGRAGSRDTLEAILAAPDRESLLDWLARRPLALRWPGDGSLLLHAGVVPQWSAAQTLSLASEASAVIAGPGRNAFLAEMYGNQPDRWRDALQGHDRIRFVINALTRLRYCDAEGAILLEDKGRPDPGRQHSIPWFQVPGRALEGTRVVFGHWSTLGRVHWPDENVSCLDTGCVWGGTLTAMNLHTGALTQVMSSLPPHP